MTIHSDWSRILYEECPKAFKQSIPKGPHSVGVIDGHLQLMRLHSGGGDSSGCWDDFIQRQFVVPIRSMFMAGCPVVVLCFDSYDSVPEFKSMTQRARMGRHSEVKVFGEHQPLPPTIPEDAMLFLMNRNFKLKLIEMLCNRVPAAVRRQGAQQLIIDYKRVVQYDAQSNAPTMLQGFECMGESDVKFMRYVTKYGGSALVHAIDGDYMAIALLYYVRNGMCPENRIHICRQLSKLPPTAAEARAKAASSTAAAAAAAGRGKPQSKKVIKCWVDMQLVFSVIAQAMWQSTSVRTINPRTLTHYSDSDAVKSAVFLMLNAGTDFSRNIPLVGPKRIWDALPFISQTLLSTVCGNPNGEDPNYNHFVRCVVGKLYSNVYARHLKHCMSSDFEAVMQCIQESSLSDTTKNRLPSQLRSETTARNVAWVMRYWMIENGRPDTPFDGSCGFMRTEAGAVCFADDLVEGGGGDDAAAGDDAMNDD